jgi:YggT family protein
MVARWSDPLLKPLQRRLMRAGANPVDAPLWLLGAVAVAGLLAVGVVRWISGTIDLVHSMRGAGAGAWIVLIIDAGISFLITALLIRVIGSWLGAGRYNKLMRPVYFLTDWLVEPIARRLPLMGRIDLSPLVAYVVLLLLRSLLASALR